jgi:lipopolysaccharide/colanic/teichoic acid biosynthesis glycosyltransferase
VELRDYLNVIAPAVRRHEPVRVDRLARRGPSEMVRLDLFYIENWSVGFDLSLILRTVPTVLLTRGAY